MADAIEKNLHPLLISYPPNLQEHAKKAYKDKLLRDYPETLRADCLTNEARITNLLLYTADIEAWHKALCSHYTNHTTRAIDTNGRQIKIEGTGNDGDLTVNIYNSGTIMFQGKEARLSSVLEDFNILKALRKRYTEAREEGGKTGKHREEEEGLREEGPKLHQDDDTPRTERNAVGEVEVHLGDQTINSLNEQRQTRQTSQSSPQFKEESRPPAQQTSPKAGPPKPQQDPPSTH